ncbi:hypothetical protein LAUMK7_05718 [Mycobacterium kansasii]|nr:hypothetical protein LAUMK22_05722 [Mycobacterium kansasii]VAZ69779.1 hypothetical protein LAUMK40_05942 [Mycobacterium kansasii]VAZ81150.1 hypothetical protein LAUMK7_05718 [Mycobacterium kansasii]
MTTNRPPSSSAPQISHTETSKAYECHWVTANGAVFSGLSKKLAIRKSWVTLWWVTATPLGTPVVPEV